MKGKVLIMKLINNYCKNKENLFILILAIVLTLSSCSSSKSSKESSGNPIYKQSELNFDDTSAEIQDIKDIKITEIRFTHNNGEIFRTTDKEIIERVKQFVINIEVNDEPYEIDESVDGGINYNLWFMDGRNVIYVMNDFLGEITINDKCYGLDKGKFSELIYYFDNPEVRLKFEKIDLD